MKHLFTFIFVLFSASSTYKVLKSQQIISTFQNADYVVGQNTFNSSTPISSSSNSLFTPSHIAVSNLGLTAIVESNINTVKLWFNFIESNGAPADLIIGQEDFFNLESISPPTASSLRFPAQVAFSPDGKKLIISDSFNHRVLIWNSIPTTNNQAADVVLGQNSFNTATASVAANGFRNPTGIHVSADGKLFVADRDNHRVLVFNSIPETNFATADVVIGQTNFTSATPGTTQSRLNKPNGVTISPDGKLIVADRDNNRILVWNSVPETNFIPADVVIGQNSFFANSIGIFNKFNWSNDVSISAHGQLSVSDFNNHRVVLYNQTPTSNGGAIDVAVGQQNLSTGIPHAPSGNPTANNMRTPTGSSYDLYGRLNVASNFGHRCLIYGNIPTDETDISISIENQLNTVCLSNTQNLIVTLTNNSTETSNGIIATASFPHNFNYESHNAQQGTYNPFSGYWVVGDLNPGESTTLNIISTAQTVGSFPAYASIVYLNKRDTDLTNNTISFQFEVTDLCDALWIGEDNTDWNNSNNWSDGLVPVANDNIIVPFLPSGNYPFIETNEAVNSLSLESGASLFIASGNNLTISGTFTNNGSITSSPGSFINISTVEEDVVISAETCPAGSFCADGVNALPCLPGSFSAFEGSESCSLCPEETYQPNAGSTECLVCIGQEEVGADECIENLCATTASIASPEFILLCNPETSTLTVDFDGDVDSIQWFKNDMPLFGATATFITVNRWSIGTYKAQGYCSGDTLESNAILVNKPIALNENGENAHYNKVCLNDTTTFTAPELAGATYEWRERPSGALVSSERTYTFTEFSGTLDVFVTSPSGCTKSTKVRVLPENEGNCDDKEDEIALPKIAQDNLAAQNRTNAMSSEVILNFYPNPVSDFYSIKLEGLAQDEVFMVSWFDLAGRQVSRTSQVSTGTGTEVKQAIGGLTKGMYIIKVNNPNHEFTFKVTVK